jgi:hypothetical protein
MHNSSKKYFGAVRGCKNKKSEETELKTDASSGA